MCYSLPLRAKAVHAAIGRFAAGLPCHSVPHLYSQACLGAPLNGAAQFFSSCFYTEAQKKKPWYLVLKSESLQKEI